LTIEAKSNIDKIIDAWRLKPAKLAAALRSGLAAGLLEFEKKRIIKSQLSGRKSQGYGLKSRTGNARNAWGIQVAWRSSIDLIGYLGAEKRAWYLKVHQHDGFNGWIFPKSQKYLHFKPNAKKKMYVNAKKVYIPKRLFIYEEFKTYGNRMIRSEIKNHLIKAANAK